MDPGSGFCDDGRHEMVQVTRTGPRNVATGNADIDRTADRGQRGEDVVWVTPGDVYANRTVAISQPVRTGLVDATDTLVQTTINAMSAAACLDRVSQDRPSGSGQEPTTSRARRHVTGMSVGMSTLLLYFAAVLCCCTDSKRGPHQFWRGPLTCGNTGRGDRI